MSLSIISRTSRFSSSSVCSRRTSSSSSSSSNSRALSHTTTHFTSKALQRPSPVNRLDGCRRFAHQQPRQETSSNDVSNSNNNNNNDNNNNSSTKRTKRGLFSNVVQAVKNIMQGDDFINPKKILERRYLHHLLLATKLRELRLIEKNKDSNYTDSLEIKEKLKEQAIEELDAKGMDVLSNVALRALMHNQLHRQVLDVCKTFEKVDATLNLTPTTTTSTSSTASDDDDDDDDNHSNNNHNDLLLSWFDGIDWNKMKIILSAEVQHTEVALELVNAAGSQEQQERSRSFLELKREALRVLQSFHGGHEDSTTNLTAATTTTTTTTDGIDVFGMDVTTIQSNKLEIIRMYQTINMCRSALIREELGYSILCLRSLLPNAGRGVFIDGEAWCGSLIAFLPGDVWPKEHLVTNAPDVMSHFENEDGVDDCQITLRFDDYVIDSRQSPVTVLTRPGSMNPFALGHMVNHPPPNTLPNCQSQMLNYTEAMVKEQESFIPYIPNSYARPLTWLSHIFVDEPLIMHGMCIMTRRDVKNEELLYDYRMQSGDIPEWYSVVEYGDEMDKEQQVFFRDDWMDKK